MEDELDAEGVGDELPLPLFDDFPEDRNGFRFSHSTFNADGIKCEVWKKDWHFLGMTVLYEKHDEGCDCSYCGEKTNKTWGIELPRCRCRNAWRILWWRDGKWPYRYTYLRCTLPRYPFVWWRCRYCRREKAKKRI